MCASFKPHSHLKHVTPIDDVWSKQTQINASVVSRHTMDPEDQLLRWSTSCLLWFGSADPVATTIQPNASSLAQHFYWLTFQKFFTSFASKEGMSQCVEVHVVHLVEGTQHVESKLQWSVALPADPATGMGENNVACGGKNVGKIILFIKKRNMKHTETVLVQHVTSGRGGNNYFCCIFLVAFLHL